MRDSFEQAALRANLAGAGLPPVALNISVQYQFCVNAGVAAAEGFFDGLADIGLHDHIALSMHVFMRSVRAGAALAGDVAPVTVQGCTDAFAAGYLGRIQQELRLFQEEGCCTGQHDAAGPPGLDAMH